MGAPKVREVGGKSAQPLAEGFMDFLLRGLTTGSFGTGAATGQYGAADPIGSTQGIAAILNDILSGGAGKVGGSFAEMINRDTERQAGAVRARYGAGGGTSFGTPAAHAEALIRAESAPRLTGTIGQLQLGAIMPLLNLMGQFASKGVSQRQTMATPNTFQSIVSGVGSVLPGIASILTGGMGGAESMFPGTIPQVTPGLGGASVPGPARPPFMMLPSGYNLSSGMGY
jgi:hypothetical protein